MTGPTDPLAHMTFRLSETGLWIAEGDGSFQHLLGLVLPDAPPPHVPTLYLPSRPFVRDGMGAYITESELDMDPMGNDEVVRWLRAMPSETTLIFLAWFLRRISNIRSDAAGHIALAEEIFGDAPIIDQFRVWCATPGHVIFSEQGLFALAARAVIHCRDEPRGQFTDPEAYAFKRLMLASTGLLHDDPESGDFGEYDQNQPEPFLAYMTQNLLFNATANLGSASARTWRMFGELARDSSRSWKTPVNLDALIEQTNLTLEQQLALAFSLYAGLGIETDFVVLLPEMWRSVCERVAPGRDPDEVIKLISATPEEMRGELTSDQARAFDPELRWSSVVFIERPFLRLRDDQLLLVSPRGIEGWPTDGIYYRMLAAARGNRKRVQHFTSFVGELTEVSTIEMIEDAHARAQREHLNVGRVLPARRLRSGDESIDLFVRDSGDVVAVEISSSRITADTRFTGDLEALQRDLEMVVLKRVVQLDRTIAAIRNDEFDDMPDVEIKRIFPVIVNVEPMRWTPMLHAYLHREVPGLLRQPGVQPLQFIEIEDMEALMSVIGPRSLPWLIDRKLQDSDMDAEFLQWFLDSPLAPTPDRPALLTEQLDRQFDTMVETLGFDTADLHEWRTQNRR